VILFLYSTHLITGDGLVREIDLVQKYFSDFGFFLTLVFF